MSAEVSLTDAKLFNKVALEKACNK